MPATERALASVDLSGAANGTVVDSPVALETDARAPAPSAQEKQAMLHLSDASHAVNHFQNQMPRASAATEECWRNVGEVPFGGVGMISSPVEEL